MLSSRRYDRQGWRRLPLDDPVRAEYERLEAQLLQTARKPKEARGGVNYLYHFVVAFRAARGDPPDAPPDPRCLSGTQPDLVHAEAAWQRMQSEAVWGPAYRREVRTVLSRALLPFGEPLAHIVNPGLYKGALAQQIQFHVSRSHRTTFTLHDCLPWRVRRLPPRSVEYGLLTRLGEHMSACLQSVSKGHMQSILVLFDHVLHDPPSLWPPGPTEDGVDDRWRYLASLSARQWLERYALTFQNHDDGQGEGGAGDASSERRIGFDLFKRQIRYLSQLYGRVLHPDTKRGIPVPASHRMTVHRQHHHRPRTTEDEEEEVAGSSSSSSSSSSCCGSFGASSFGSSGAATSEADNQAAEERRQLLQMLGDLRQRCCRAPVSPIDAAERAYAFQPQEVRRMVEMACTTQEMLMLMLFLTTGMRVGGVARLQLRGRAPRTAADVPPELYTTEKHNRVRTIRPTQCCRVLLARWYTQGRRTTPGHEQSPYVFPCPQGREDRSVSPRHVWQVCRGLFHRAGVRGPHVHPHTFRHTVVQMLFLTGSSFENIAKWIGHSSPQVTASVYGRLSQQDLEASLGSVPFLGSAGGTTQRPVVGSGGSAEEWKALAEFLREPYHFETDRGTTMDASASRPTKQMKRDLLERAQTTSSMESMLMAQQSVNAQLRQSMALLQTALQQQQQQQRSAT